MERGDYNRVTVSGVRDDLSLTPPTKTPTARSPTSGGPSGSGTEESRLRERRKALDRLGLVVEVLEHRQQLRHREQIDVTAVGLEQLEPAACGRHGVMAGQELGQAGAVDVRHAIEV